MHQLEYRPLIAWGGAFGNGPAVKSPLAGRGLKEYREDFHRADGCTGIDAVWSKPLVDAAEEAAGEMVMTSPLIRNGLSIFDDVLNDLRHDPPKDA